MSFADFPALKKLSDAKKMKLADQLWRSVMRDDVPVTSGQKKILNTRWAAYKSGLVKSISLAEMERRLAKK